MATLTIRLPDDKHERLRLLARRRRISMNKLVNEALLAALARLAIGEEMSTVVLAQSDAEPRFRARAARGSTRKALQLLDKLDKVSRAA